MEQDDLEIKEWIMNWAKKTKNRKMILNLSQVVTGRIKDIYCPLTGDLEKRGIPERPIFGQQVTVMNETEKQYLKQARKEEKKLLKTAKQIAEDDSIDDFSPETLKAKR